MNAPDISDTFGAAFIGLAVMMALYGLTTLQTYFYFMSYEKDGRGMKFLVSLVWVLDTVHAALVCHAMYYYLIKNYAHPQGLAIGTVTLYTSVLVNLMISTIVQGFFVKRIFILTSVKFRWWLAAFTSLLVVGHVVFGLVTVIALYIKKRLDRLPELTAYGATPFAIFAVLADIAIAASLCVLLHNRRTAFSSTNALVSTLIIYAINRCLLTSVTAVIEIIVFAAMPKSFWFLAVDFVIGKLYANSLLATLNTRHSLRTGVIDTSSTNNMHMSTSLRWGSSTRPDGSTLDNSHSEHSTGNHTGNIGVAITKESMTDGDRASTDGRTSQTGKVIAFV